MRVRNFTPHPLAIHDCRSDGGLIARYDSEGVIRATEEDEPGAQTFTLDGFNEATTDEEKKALGMSGHMGIVAAVVRRKYTGVEGLPPIFGIEDGPGALFPGDLLVVSLVTGQAMAQARRPWDEKRPTLLDYLRDAGIEVVMPDTGPGGAVRDDEGRIIGTKRLVLA